MPGRGDLPQDALPQKWEPFVKINYAFGEGADVINKLSGRVRHGSTTSRTRRSNHGSRVPITHRRTSADRGQTSPSSHPKSERLPMRLLLQIRHF